MPTSKLFLVDSDVFITAKNRYYAFDLCPGFWKSVIRRHADGGVGSIDRVRAELLAGRKTEDLVLWVKSEVPATFFFDADQDEVVEKFEEIMLWVQRSPQFTDGAKAKFATAADGWLVAYAATHAGAVVTNEQSAPNSRNNIKLPDVCDQFGVARADTFEMLRTLVVRFDWNEPQ
ncbi:MAG: DUF4411 family protein [Polyangiaceae bacterium]